MYGDRITCGHGSYMLSKLFVVIFIACVLFLEIRNIYYVDSSGGLDM